MGLQEGTHFFWDSGRDSKGGPKKGTQIFWDSKQESGKGRMGPMENI
jgi:hypothetical protein